MRAAEAVFIFKAIVKIPIWVYNVNEKGSKKGREAVDEKRGIRYFPIGLFASVMGFAGVTIAVKQAEILNQASHFVSSIAAALTTLLFLLYIVVFIYRIIRYYEDVKNDFQHPVKMNFFAAISISLLLLSVLYVEISQILSIGLLLIGGAMQLSLTLAILSKLIWRHSFAVEQFNPAWFIPIVGNVIVPLAGVHHDLPNDILWLFFGIGILFSIIYFALFFVRAYFYAPFPKKLWPTVFILMAPPAIGFVSYVKITETVDAFANILYGVAFFIGLFLLVHIKRFMTIPFFVSWWAFLFPSAAMTIATANMYLFHRYEFYQWLFYLQLLGLIGLTVFLSWKTIRLAIDRKLCVKE